MTDNWKATELMSGGFGEAEEMLELDARERSAGKVGGVG